MFHKFCSFTPIINNSIFPKHSGNSQGISNKPIKIEIFIAGETHSDPSAKSAVANAISTFADSKIPIIYCPEKQGNLHDSIVVSERLTKEIELFQKFITDNKLDEFYSLEKDLNSPHLSPSGKINLNKRISDILGEDNSEFCNDIFTSLSKSEGSPECGFVPVSGDPSRKKTRSG